MTSGALATECRNVWHGERKWGAFLIRVDNVGRCVTLSDRINTVSLYWSVLGLHSKQLVSTQDRYLTGSYYYTCLHWMNKHVCFHWIRVTIINRFLISNRTRWDLDLYQDLSFSSNNILFWFVRYKLIHFHWVIQWRLMWHQGAASTKWSLEIFLSGTTVTCHWNLDL